MYRLAVKAGGLWVLFCAVLSGRTVVAGPAYTVVDLYAFRGTAYTAAGGQAGGTAGNQPMYWSADGTPHNLAPAGNDMGAVYGIGGPFQVGYLNQNAALWEGSSSAGWLDLATATGFSSSTATAIAGAGGNAVIVGYGSTGGPTVDNVAVMWSGPYFGTVTGLNGIHYIESEALATDGVHEVGWGADASGIHALLWAGSSDSIDLTPTNIPGFTSAKALGVQGQQQVGEVVNAQNKTHAVVWAGSAASAIDLHPSNLSGIVESAAVATNGVQQVGWGDNGIPGALVASALVWSGSANSVVDLQSLLDPAEFVSSQAYGIDAGGDVFGIATDTSGLSHAIEWQAVPEPAGLGVVVLISMALARTKRPA